MYGVFNRGLRKLRGLEEFLGATVIRCVVATPTDLTATVGWGRSRFARRAIRVAAARKIPFICLEDGLRFKMLKRHLKEAYGMSPDDYRNKWGLPSDYPMAAPSYSRAKGEIARKLKLGRYLRR